MNDKFDELIIAPAQSVMVRLVCLALAVLPLSPAFANDFHRGPLIDLSDPDLLVACDSNGAEKESSIAVNPINPKNVVVAWIGGKGIGIGGAVSFDGGKRWQQIVIPGLSACSGGNQGFEGNSDPWLSFAPEGTLHFVCVAAGADRRAILTTKSLDGGLHWAAPIALSDTTDKRFFGDKPVLAADPTANGFVYAIWGIDANGNRGQSVLSRSTDGGSTWEPARFIYDPGITDSTTSGSSLVVRPDGTLIFFFSENKYPDGGTHQGAVASIIRSTDKGLTWSAPIVIASIPVFRVYDPETGTGINNSSSEFPNYGAAVDPNNGNLYAAWEDNGFSNGQYSSIACSMSADGGFTWSAPIPVSKTPGNIAVSNRNAFIPAVAVTADGTVGVSYYDFRFNDPGAGLPTDYWLVHCHASATVSPANPANWRNETRLSDASFNLQVQAQFPHYWVGDYEGLTTVGNDFLAAWSQMFDNDFDSVFFRRVGP